MNGVMSFLTSHTYLGNSLWRYAGLFVVLLAGLAAGRTLRFLMERAGERIQAVPERRTAGLFLTCLGRPAALFGVVVALQIGMAAVLKLDAQIVLIAQQVIRILYAVSIGYAIYRLMDVVDDLLTQFAARTESKLDDMLVPLVRKALRGVIVIVVALFVLQNIVGAEQLTTLLAGLGVGGLAVALAAQESIKNFFGSVMIFLDKPFQVGDRVVIAGHDGPVESVGFRSTRLRTLEGNLVTIPNSAVANETILNIGRRPHIRRVTDIALTYDTPPEKVRRAVEIVREILKDHEGMHPDFPPRVFFNDFKDAALNLSVIYWYHPPSYWPYMEFTQRVNLAILDRFTAEGIEFAFPTQTVYLANDAKRQLALKMLNSPASAQ